MKLLSLLALILPVAASANCELNGGIYPLGAKVKFYYTNQSAKIGPNYSCEDLSRVRTCGFKGVWSANQPECSQFDSGGCVDWWVDQMADSSFRYTSCN